MVRSRQLAGPSARSGAIRLTVTAVERGRDHGGTTRLLALHGVNAGRPWRLSMPDAVAASGTGRYVFEVHVLGERRRAEVLATDGERRLGAPSPVHGDLLEHLPDWTDAGRIPAARQPAHEAVTTETPA